MVLIVERKKHNASPLSMSLVVLTNLFYVILRAMVCLSVTYLCIQKIYLVLMSKSEIDADNPFVFGDEGRCIA